MLFIKEINYSITGDNKNRDKNKYGSIDRFTGPGESAANWRKNKH